MTVDALEIDTKSHLLRVAGRIFAERGFRATSVRYIVTRAGVNQAAVNYHFGGKQGLYRAVIQEELAVSSVMTALSADTTATGEAILYECADRLIRHYNAALRTVPQILGWEIVEPHLGVGRALQEQLAPLAAQVAALAAPFFSKTLPATDRQSAVQWFLMACLLPPLTRPAGGPTPHATAPDPTGRPLSNDAIERGARAAVAGFLALATDGGETRP